MMLQVLALTDYMNKIEYEKLKSPVLSVYTSKDTLVSTEKIKEVYLRLGSKKTADDHQKSPRRA